MNIAVDLAANCHRLYRQAPPATRRLLNRAFFEGLFLNADGGVGGATLAAPFATILSTQAVQRGHASARERPAKGLKQQTPSRDLRPGVLVRDFWWS